MSERIFAMGISGTPKNMVGAVCATLGDVSSPSSLLACMDSCGWRGVSLMYMCVCRRACGHQGSSARSDLRIPFCRHPTMATHEYLTDGGGEAASSARGHQPSQETERSGDVKRLVALDDQRKNVEEKSRAPDEILLDKSGEKDAGVPQEEGGNHHFPGAVIQPKQSNAGTCPLCAPSRRHNAPRLPSF